MKKCLVAGGAGFLGANLARRLVRLGMEVHVLVEPETDLWRLHDQLYRLEVHRADITDADAVKNIVELVKPDIVLNAASYGGLAHQEDRKLIYDTNFTGTINLFMACKKVGFDCFINAGSSEEYGFHPEPVSEATALQPRTHYGVSKASATYFCLREALTHDLPVYVVRPFVAYGDFEARSKLVGSLMVGALKKAPTMLIAPEAIRDFIYIEDVVDLFMLIVKRKPSAHYVFNGGTGTAIRVKDLVEETRKIFSNNIDVRWEFMGEGDVQNGTSLVSNNSLATERLGWTPKHTLAEGLVKSAEWFSRNSYLYDSGDKERKFTMSLI
jgi:nucleoside-diphosphate-sugar epimerase